MSIVTTYKPVAFILRRGIGAAQATSPTVYEYILPISSEKDVSQQIFIYYQCIC